MRKLLINILLFSLIVFNGNAQQFMDRIDPTGSGALYKNNVLNQNENSKIEGSKYFDEEFRLAKVSGVPQQIMIRYDAMMDIIEVQSENKELFTLIKKAPCLSIRIIPYNNIIKLLNYETKEGELNGYLAELLSLNNVALFRRYRVSLQREKKAANAYLSATPAKFIKTSDEYYLSLNDKTAIPLPKNRTELQNLFPTHKKEIADYLKQNDFSIKDEKSIIEMVKFISKF
ncbi:MAG: hypothetical protein ACI9M1_001663 [Porticoccaceae bacterium]|jgi:hypothetical protein